MHFPGGHDGIWEAGVINKNREGSDWAWRETFSPWGWSSSGAGYHRKLCSLHPLQLWKPGYIQPWKAWSDLRGEVALWRVVSCRPPEILPIWIILQSYVNEKGDALSEVSLDHHILYIFCLASQNKSSMKIEEKCLFHRTSCKHDE